MESFRGNLWKKNGTFFSPGILINYLQGRLTGISELFPDYGGSVSVRFTMNDQ
jgi:hypothetical protein